MSGYQRNDLSARTRTSRLLASAPRSAERGPALDTAKHTPRHIHCPACEAQRATRTFLLSRTQTFAAAARHFLDTLSAPGDEIFARYRKPRTLRDLRTKIKALNKFFGDIPLEDIHLGTIRSYQAARSANELETDTGTEHPWHKTANGRKTNYEITVLRRILRLAKCEPEEVCDHYMRLIEEDAEIPPALSPDEQERFFRTAEAEPEWNVILWYSMLAVHLCFSSDEMRTMLQSDVNLRHGIIAVNRRHGKNPARRREVPATDPGALWAAERLLMRSYELVGRAPYHHLLPLRICRGQWDGLQPTSESGLRKPFDAVRKQAGLEWFKMNGWRHTGITRFAEAGVPIPVISARAGHMSAKMTAHYTHISEQALRRASQAAPTRPGFKLEGPGKGPVSIEAAQLRRSLVGY